MRNVKNSFKKWWRGLTAVQKRQIAKKAKTIPNYLDQIAVGSRKLTVEMAARIEEVTGRKVKRGEIHPLCAKCPHYLGKGEK